MSDGADWHVAPLTVDDADEVGLVHVKVWQETYAGIMPAEFLAGLDPRRRADLWRSLAEAPQPGSTVLVARGSHGRIVGFISVGPTRDADAPTPDELYALNLLAEAKGTGLAQRLLDGALGARDATLWVAEDNARARAFYSRNDFVPEGARSAHAGSGASEIRMIRTRRPQRGVTAS